MIRVATFEIEYEQFLDTSGQATQPLPAFAQDIQTLVSLYEMMTELRAYDAKAISLQRTGQMGTYASILGQEAIGVGIGHAMQADDVYVPYYRDYGVQIMRGVRFSEIYRYWGGDERGSCFAHNAKDLPICVPIATQCLHAAGIATAMKIRQQPQAVVVSIGEGGTSEGDFYEAINVAGAWDLPVVFVINNNQWAISVPAQAQTKCQTFAQKAIAAGIPGIQVDGNDIIAVREVIAQSLTKARAGGGATLVEAITYRLPDHTTADDATRYRSAEEVEQAWQREPLLRLRHYLTAQGAWDNERETALAARCAEKVNAEVAAYKATPPEPPEAMIDYLYATLPEALSEQRETIIEYGVVKHD